VVCSCGSFQGYRRCTNFEAIQVQGVSAFILPGFALLWHWFWGSSRLDIIPSYQMLSILMDMFLCSSLFQELIVILPGRWPTACSGWQINGRELESLSGCFPPCSMSPPLSLTPSFADRWHWEIRESDRVSSQTDPPGNIGESSVYAYFVHLDWQSFPVN
jgi:hypothetical protein